MAAETLKKLKAMFTYKTSDRDTEIEPVTVIDIHRYLTDPSFPHPATNSSNASSSDTSQKAVQSVDAYDLTLADGYNKMKVLVSCHLHILIQQTKLVIGSVLEISRSVVTYDETNLNDDGVLVLCDVDITGYEPEHIQELKDLPWYPENCIRQTECRPLTTERGCYLNLWTSADVVLPQTINTGPEEFDENETGDLFTIKEVATQWRNISKFKPALLVRVLQKSRLLHFGKPDKIGKWPFQHQLLVADQTGMCTLVFWNNLCLQFLKCIEEGSVLMLRNYTVKSSFSQNVGWCYHDDSVRKFDIDLNINPHHPITEVKMIKHSSVPRELHLPDLTYKLVTRSQLGTLPDNFICDITGLVTYVSRVKREAMKSKLQFDSGAFWLWRYVHIQDGTSERPAIIQLYRTNQSCVFDELCPGQMVMYRHMRVVHHLDTVKSSRQWRPVYLTSTSISQYYTYHPVKSNRTHMFEKEKQVKDLRSWRKHLDMKTVKFKTGGYYSYPPMPLEKQEVLSSSITITPSGEQWCSAVRNMAFREHQVMFVQARLTAVWSNRTTQRVEADNFVEVNPSLALGMDPEFENADIWPKEFNPQKDQLEPDFPSASDGDRTTEDTLDTLENMDCLYLLWMGLNCNTVLQTIKPLMCHQVPQNINFLDLVAGKHDSNTLQYSRISQKGFDRCLMSSRDFLNHRFLLVVDLYRTSASSVNVLLNRAFVL